VVGVLVRCAVGEMGQEYQQQEDAMKYKALIVRDVAVASYDGVSCKSTEVLNVVIDVCNADDRTFLNTGGSHLITGDWRIVDIEEATDAPSTE